MLLCHSCKGLALWVTVRLATGVAAMVLTVLATKPIPVPDGFVVWHARQSAPFELSITRNLELGSMFCTCGLWQLVHSTLPLMSFTCPVVSAVIGGGSGEHKTELQSR